MKKQTIALLLVLLMGFLSCEKGESPVVNPALSFDRSALLAQWADNIIIPSFANYKNELDQLGTAKSAFLSNPTETEFEALRSAWLSAYTAWQDVSIFDIGKAEEIGLRNFSNIFPTNTELINNNIQGQNYSLTLPSNFAAQGFPALDYLLYGIADDKLEIIEAITESNTAQYLSDVVDRLISIGTEVTEDWQGGYRDQFVGNSGSSATAATDKLVNDFLFYYEKFLRAGKIGIPAGIFSGSTISESVEAPYSGIYSKMFFITGLEAVERFFNGESYNGGTNGVGLDDYIAHVAEQNNTANISSDILAQWSSATAQANNLSDNFKNQVETDNSKMLETYDELQKAVPLLKVDMLQALNIQVDFVDADGD